MRITLYSKRRCPLCEDAKEVLEALKARYVFELELRYIDDAPMDFERFRFDVPVLFIDGERVAHHRIDGADVEKRLLTAGTRVAQ